MKTLKLLSVLAVSVAFSLVACKKGTSVETKEKAPAAKEDSADKAGTDKKDVASDGEFSKDDFVKASVELACLGQKEKDPNKLSGLIMETYKKYNIDQQKLGKLMTKYAQDQDVAKAISEGAHACMK
jgi:hypothetical protein